MGHRPFRHSLAMLCLLCAAAVLSAPSSAGDDGPADPVERRLPWSSAAPDWLQAVGVLNVPGVRFEEGRRRHLQEQCSATLVKRGSRRAGADTIVTAWHCLEFYGDLSRPITFTLAAGVDAPVVTRARLLADGGGMHSDWAILRLQRPVPPGYASAMAIHPGRADPGRPIVMAGYSRDAGLGQGGTRLTYDPDCAIVRQGRRESDSDCAAYKGASGGAVVQLSPGGEPLLAGVVSRGDGEDVSTYVPVAGFRSAIERHLGH